MKKLIYSAALVSALLFSANQLTFAEFKDVPATHQNYNDIQFLLDKGVIDDGTTFGVNEIVTRADVAVMVAKALGLDGTQRDTIFKDVPKSNKNSGYIQSAVENGVIKGYTDGTFKPDVKVTRGHMATFIARAFDLPEGSKTFKDVKKGSTAYEAVSQLAAANITTGYTDGTFKPENNLTRAHISAFLARAIKYQESTSEKTEVTPTKSNDERFAGYKLIEVDGGDLSGHREANVVVDIGFGDREYWAFTNEHGQLVRVIADKITLQDDNTEPVTSQGRYYSDEAKVPGVERSDLDEGHIIADSMGGVSNAYNITPQESTLNRHGDQAYMEDAIRKAGGATNFEAIITYPDTKTQIPSSYQYTYTIKGNTVTDKFDNVNPDKVNEEQGLTETTTTTTTTTTPSKTYKNCTELRKDFPDGVSSSHSAYQSKMDRDKDGWACER